MVVAQVFLYRHTTFIKLPIVVIESEKRGSKKVRTIPDSIEGWSDAVGSFNRPVTLIRKNYFPEYVQEKMFSLIFLKLDRQDHSLNSSSGKAPGAESL